MSTTKGIERRLPVLAVLLSACALLTFAGCKGDSATAAPFGSTISVTEIIHSTSTPTSGTFNVATYRVTALDSTGFPMANIGVDLLGGFDDGTNIVMNNDAFGSVGLTPLVLKSKLTLNNSGFADFDIYAPTIVQRALVDPALPTASLVPDGGTISSNPTATTYSYAITALDAVGGETLPSPTVSILVSVNSTTTPGGAIELLWTAVSGASAYRVYGNGGAGTLGFLATVASSTTRFLDTTGAGGIIGVPVANGTGIAINSVRGELQVTSGSVMADKLVVTLP